MAKKIAAKIIAPRPELTQEQELTAWHDYLDRELDDLHKRAIALRMDFLSRLNKPETKDEHGCVLTGVGSCWAIGSDLLKWHGDDLIKADVMMVTWQRFQERKADLPLNEILAEVVDRATEALTDCPSYYGLDVEVNGSGYQNQNAIEARIQVKSIRRNLMWLLRSYQKIMAMKKVD